MDEAAGAEVRRRTVTAMIDSKLCFIHKDALKGLADRYPELALRIKRLARAEAKVNKKGKKFHEAMEASKLRNSLGASAVKMLSASTRNGKDRSSASASDCAGSQTSPGSTRSNALPQSVSEQLARQQRQLTEQSVQLMEQKEMLKTVMASLQEVQAAVALGSKT